MRERSAYRLRRFNISIPDDLVYELDKPAQSHYCSRSQYIREAVRQRLLADNHVEAVVANPQSYFNMIRRSNFAARHQKFWNRIKYSELKLDD